ncbi:phage tail protein [Actinopolymorpha sp. NPDC004070]|uniref:phage tail protein n=1 Tax=Actinopolymorpha sp. NPDC004070 TaxID=3154548 RepID=UPI0033AFCE45
MLPPALLAPADPDGVPVLLALLEALEGQWLELAADADRVLDDAFPDSAADWALPYLAQVLGLPPDAGRAEIGSATALRRRRGTPAAIEDFATVVTGWQARVTEGWQTTIWAQQLRHPIRRTASLSLRRREHLMAGTGLDPARRSLTPGGPHHPAAVTATVFPWQVRRFELSEACPLPDGRFAVHPLGLPAPLYLRPDAVVVGGDADDERPPGSPPALRPPRAAGDLPLRATWRLIEALAPDEVGYGPVWQLGPGHPLTAGAADDPALLAITVDGDPVPWTDIGLTSLPSGGGPTPTADQVLVDLARGVLLPGANRTGPLRVMAYRPTPGRIGALASDAEGDDRAGTVIVVDPALGPHAPGQTVVTTLADAVTAALALPGSRTAPAGHPDVEIRLATSDRLAAPPPLTATPALTRWRIVAPTGLTPVVTGTWEVRAPGLHLDLAGMFLEGDLAIGADMASVTLTGVTTNPAAGRTVTVEPGAWTLRLRAVNCHLGPIRADLSAFPIDLADCVVDGAGATLSPCGAPPPAPAPVPAVAATDRFPPQLRTNGCTFAGLVAVDTITASDCLFLDGVRAVVTSAGGLRFCHLGDADDAQAHPSPFCCLTGPLPALASTGAESAGYYAPVLTAPTGRGADPALSGASDGGEIGAYHHARRGPLALRLAQRLPEMTPLTVHPHLDIIGSEE